MEFNAKENITENITEIVNPNIGNAYRETSADPNSAAPRHMNEHIVNVFRTSLESTNFRINNPARQPTDINPQNRAIADAPSTSGSKP